MQLQLNNGKICKDIARRFSSMCKNIDFKKEWVRLARTNGIGPLTFFSLLDMFGSPEIAIENIISMKKNGKIHQSINVPSKIQIEEEFYMSEKFGAEILITCDPLFPQLLLEIKMPPPLLIAKGKISLLNSHKVGIIGSRNASVNGIILAKDMARELGKSGFTIVSGLADGIDKSAHEGSIEYGTIGVAGNGIDYVYPKQCQNIYDMMYKKGVIISEYPISSQPIAKHFPERNRLIAGLCYGVVVVEASYNSGSLITAKMAIDEGREVFAVPGFPLDPRARGCNFLLKDGAILIENSDDVISEMRKIMNIRNSQLSQKSKSKVFNTKNGKLEQYALFDTEEDILLDVISHENINFEDYSNNNSTLKELVVDKLSSSSATDIDRLMQILSCMGYNPKYILFAISELELEGRLERGRYNELKLFSQ